MAPRHNAAEHLVQVSFRTARLWIFPVLPVDHEDVEGGLESGARTARHFPHPQPLGSTRL